MFLCLKSSGSRLMCGALGVHSAICLLSLLSNVCRKNLRFFYHFLPISKWAYIINTFLFNWISVINFIHACLSPTSTMTLWPLLKWGKISSHFHISATVPSPHSGQPSLSYDQHVMSRKSYCPFSKFEIFPKKSDICTWVTIDLLSDLICSACHCFVFAAFNDTFGTIQNIYLTFSLFCLSV